MAIEREFKSTVCYDYFDYFENQIKTMETLITNLNVTFIIEELKPIVDKAVDFEIYDFIGDIGDFVGFVWKTPDLYRLSEIPPILHFELWFHELQDLVESVFKAYSKYDWTV